MRYSFSDVMKFVRLCARSFAPTTSPGNAGSPSIAISGNLLGVWRGGGGVLLGKVRSLLYGIVHTITKVRDYWKLCGLSLGASLRTEHSAVTMTSLLEK